MGTVEDVLRETFASRVAEPPVADDVAGRAIRNAAQVRRRRTALVSAMAALSVAAVGTGIVSITGRGGGPVGGVGASSTASTSPSPITTGAPLVRAVLPVDVLNGDRIQGATGTVVTLDGLGEAQRAWRVDGGWLVETYRFDEGKAMVWLVTETGGQTLLALGDSAMVSAGSASRPGPQIAWTLFGTLYLGTYRGGRVTETEATAGVALHPQVVVGSGVVLAGTRTGGGLDIWDMWFPDRGAYEPTTDNSNGLSSLLGTTVDNERIIGVYNGKSMCLGEMDPQAFTPVRSNCSIHFNLDDRVFPSPDGRWWAVIGPSGIRLYDATKVWGSTADEPTASWPVQGPHAAVWTRDSASFVVTTSTEVLTVYPQAGRSYDSVPLPPSGAPGANRLPIADLR
jgi:hypothetical protein